MCGIVGAVAGRDVLDILIAGLKALEYRGYDSAGLCVPQGAQLARLRTAGKVARLAALQAEAKLTATSGIAHTRWATHGAPTTNNAHPIASHERVAVVHNGIIENHTALRAELTAAGYAFATETDTEVIAHLVHQQRARGEDLLPAVLNVVRRLEGAYAIAVMDAEAPGRMIGARFGSPLVAGLGFDEHFLASDTHALLPVTNRFVYLEDGDVVDVRRDLLTIVGLDGVPVERPIAESNLSQESVDLGQYAHYMLKEIFEQPGVAAETLEGRIVGRPGRPVLGQAVDALVAGAKAVHIVACGTSYHAGMVARYWVEALAGIPCQVEIASEFRYRDVVVLPETLFVTVSQSGETADTLAALRKARQIGYRGTLAVCNKPESSLVRESDAALMTRAGPEIGVASTKAFTTQLTALALVALELGRLGNTRPETIVRHTEALRALPLALERALGLDEPIRRLATVFGPKHHALFLGRGVQYPIALEGALKLKEISYIHAEAYPAGELKHGPLALVDDEMPVIAVAPGDQLLEKLKSNIAEVRARGGELFVIADEDSAVDFENDDGHLIKVPHVNDFIAPIVMTVPLQLLAYHVAVIKGTDVDQPRNLAKSVTVE